MTKLLQIVTFPSPFAPGGETVQVLESPDCDQQRLARQLFSGEYDKPFVVDDGSTRTLHFSLSLIQSSMSLKDPFALELDYTQAMMGFLLFLPHPKHIFMLGLGGGSLAKFCYRYLSGTRISVVEIDPRVIGFREVFELPPDDGRLQVIEGDGAAWMARSREWEPRPDVVMMDAFDRYGLADSVGNLDFYRAVHAALSGRGVLVANLAGAKDGREEHRALIGAAFDDRLVSLSLPDGNDIVVAFRNQAFKPRWREVGNAAKALRARLGLDFPKFAQRFERESRMHYF